VRGARHEIERQRARLDSAFERIRSISENDTEARADFAKYLCVRVSGYLETSISGLLEAYAAGQSGPAIARYMSAELSRFQNARREKIVDLLGKFDDRWRDDLTAYLVDERADAIGTIVKNRHLIAHGADSTITYTRVKEHWKVIQQIVDHIADLLDPPRPRS